MKSEEENIITGLKDVKPGPNILKLYHWAESPFTLSMKHLSNQRGLYLSDHKYVWHSPHVPGMECYEVVVKLNNPFIFHPDSNPYGEDIKPYEWLSVSLREWADADHCDGIIYYPLDHKLIHTFDCLHQVYVFNPKDSVISIKRDVAFTPKSKQGWCGAIVSITELMGRLKAVADATPSGRLSQDYELLMKVQQAGGLELYVKSQVYVDKDMHELIEVFCNTHLRNFILRDMVLPKLVPDAPREVAETVIFRYLVKHDYLLFFYKVTNW